MYKTRKKNIVFFSNPDNNKAIWLPLIEKMQAEDTTSSNYNFLIFEPTQTGNNSLETYADQFDIWYQKELQSPDLKNTDVIFVGHGLGGLILQYFIVEKLKKGDSKIFYNLKQLILISTPNSSYSQSSKNKNWFSKFKKKNYFEKTLEQWDREIQILYKEVKEFITEPDFFSNYHRPVLITNFHSQYDDFVSLETINKPLEIIRSEKDLSVIHDLSNNENFKKIVHILKNPTPHKGIFMVEILETLIKVTPLKNDEIEVEHGNQTRLVKTDNKGEINRKIQFSKENICNQLFSFRYGIENKEGFIRAEIKGAKNQTSSFNIDDYNLKGLEYNFEFEPKINSHKSYELNVMLLKAFDKNHRNVHFHLGEGKVRYNKLKYILDLSHFLKVGILISPTPKLMLHPEDVHNCGDGFDMERKNSSNIIPIRKIGEGIWEWEIYDIGGGVIDIFWDLDDE